jgi:hypothetical protein
MKFLIILIPFLFTSCDDVQTERIIRGSAAAIDGYYGRPAYYPPPATTVVTPVAPVYPY